jgi:drug/metabolite transporter (DMT)-like permease
MSCAALLQTTPLFVTLGAILFFGERVGWRRWLALAVGLMGVLVILRPGMDAFQPEAIFALTSAIGIALRDLATRRRPEHVHTIQLAIWGFLMLVPVGAIMLAFGDDPVRMTGIETAYMIAATLIGMISYYGLALAVQIGEISFVTPFRYTRLVFAIALAAGLFAEWPDMLTLLGAAIIVAAGLYTLIRERREIGKRPFQTALGESMTGARDT